MTIEERKLTPAGQGNLQQIKLGIPVVEALNRMAEDPMGENEKLLLRILEQNKDTEYGRKYGFANIHSIEEYQKKVPVSVYDDYAGYILRMSEDGEENLITSGKVVHYNKSSGTVGNPKRIPLTEEAFQVFQKYNGPYRKRTRRRLDQRTEYVHCGIHCRDPAREKRCYLWGFVSKNDR
jgi:hypothetical protein